LDADRRHAALVNRVTGAVDHHDLGGQEDAGDRGAIGAGIDRAVAVKARTVSQFTVNRAANGPKPFKTQADIDKAQRGVQRMLAKARRKREAEEAAKGRFTAEVDETAPLAVVKVQYIEVICDDPAGTNELAFWYAQADKAGTSCSAGVGCFQLPQRPQSVSSFRHPRRHAPDVIAGEVYVRPAERREMDKQLVWNLLGLA